MTARKCPGTLTASLKAWLTKIELVNFNLEADKLDGNSLWCQDWCPFPPNVAYYENTKNLVIPLEYYYSYPELFDDLDPAYPLIDPLTSEPFWNASTTEGEDRVIITTFKDYITNEELANVAKKYPFFFDLSVLAIPISEYISGSIDLEKITFKPFPPYWDSENQVSFVNL